LLHLTRLDLFDARYAIEADVINIGTGLGSIALALLGAPPVVAGLFYFVLGRSAPCTVPGADGIAARSSDPSDIGTLLGCQGCPRRPAESDQVEQGPAG
jgi:hypothetical protein